MLNFTTPLRQWNTRLVNALDSSRKWSHLEAIAESFLINRIRGRYSSRGCIAAASSLSTTLEVITGSISQCAVAMWNSIEEFILFASSILRFGACMSSTILVVTKTYHVAADSIMIIHRYCSSASNGDYIKFVRL